MTRTKERVGSCGGVKVRVRRSLVFSHKTQEFSHKKPGSSPVSSVMPRHPVTLKLQYPTCFLDFQSASAP